MHQPVPEAKKSVLCKMMINADILTGDTLMITLETARSLSTTTIVAKKSTRSGHRYQIPLLLSELTDKTVFKDIAEQYVYDTYGIYHKQDTLVSYKAFIDQWSIIAGNTHYTFRIQNNAQKQVISPEHSLNPKGDSFDIEVSVYGADHIQSGTKRVKAVRRKITNC